MKSTDQQLENNEPIFANFQEACPALGIPDGPDGPHNELPTKNSPKSYQPVIRALLD